MKSELMDLIISRVNAQLKAFSPKTLQQAELVSALYEVGEYYRQQGYQRGKVLDLIKKY